MWKNALFAAQSFSVKVVFGQATQVAYSNMSWIIPIEIKDLYMGEGRAECVVYNLAHAIRPQLKRNLIKFLIRGLPTRDKLAHFTNPKLKLLTLPLRKGVAKLIFWRNVLWLRGLLQAMGKKCILLNIPSWQETKNVCGFVSKFFTKQETSVVSVALLSLWLTVCAEGLKSPQYFLRKNKILPQPPRTQTKKGTQRKGKF